MAEGVRADALGQSDSFTEHLDDVEDHNAGDVFPFAADENEIFITG